MKTILVLEDELPLQVAIRLKLESAGYDVVTARSVDQAREYLEEVPNLSAIWLDHYLIGKGSGLDFVASLKEEDSKWKNTPIFVVSNTASADKVRTYLRLGAQKYYTKSDHRLEAIVDEITDYLSARESSVE